MSQQPVQEKARTRSAQLEKGHRRSAVLTLVLSLAAALTVGSSSATAVAAESGVLVDSFGRGDDWRLGSAETGQEWQVWSGTAVVSGEQAAASVSGYTLAVADSGVSSGVVGLSVPVISEEFWMVFRASNSGNYWRFGRWAGGAYELQQIRGWALGSPAVTVQATVVPAAGDRLECRLGSEVSCFVNGVAVVSSADGFNSGSSFFGFAMADGSGVPAARVDDVLVGAPVAEPDVAAGVVADLGDVAVGEALSWTVTVSNVGTAVADGVVLSGALPAGVSGVVASSADGSCVVGSEIRCELGSLAPSGSVAVSVSGSAPDVAQTVTLNVAVSADPTDTSLLNNVASAGIEVSNPGVVPLFPIVVDNFDRPASWTMGTATTGQLWEVWQGTARVADGRAFASEPGYTMSVIDHGVPSASVATSVPNVFSDFWLIARASNSGNYWRFGSTGGGNYALQQVRGWALGSPRVESYNAVVPSAGDRLECRSLVGITCFVNGVAVASSRDSFNSSATRGGFAAAGVGAAPTVRFDDYVASAPEPAPDLAVELRAEQLAVVAGEPMVWRATVSNSGPLPASGVQVRSVKPSGVVFNTVGSSVGSCDPSAVDMLCSIGTLASGASVTIDFIATAPTELGARTLVVSVNSSEDDADLSTNTDSATTNVRVLAGPGDTVVDSFNRPNSAVLGSEAAGRPWEMLQGSMGIVDGQATKTHSGSGAAMAVIDPGFTFGTMQVTIASGSADGFHLVFRGRDVSNYYRVGPDSSGNYGVQKIRNGAITGLQFNSVRKLQKAADGDVIRLVVRPDDGWFVSVNGLHVIDGGDVDLLGEFRFGLQANSSAVRFDDLQITQQLGTGITTTEAFDQSNGSRLELKYPTSGTQYQWMTPQGYWVTQSGRGVLESPGFGVAYLETSSQLSTLKATFHAPNAASWLVMRYSHSGGYYLFGHPNSPDEGATGGSYMFHRVGVDGELASIPGGATVHAVVTARAGDDVVVRQKGNGTIEGWVNGIHVATVVDLINGVEGSQYGLAGELGATFDDFVVGPYSDTPTVVNDALVTLTGRANAVDVLGNDSSFEAGGLSVTAWSQATSGSVSCTTAGVCTYTPNAGLAVPFTDSFTYTVRAASGATATGTVNVRVVSAPRVTMTGGAATEGNIGKSNPVPFTITLTGEAPFPVTVDYLTGGSTAVQGADFVKTSGTLTFPASTDTTRTQTVNVATIGDIAIEKNERFYLYLRNPRNAALPTTTQYRVLATIINDD